MKVEICLHLPILTRKFTCSLVWSGMQVTANLLGTEVGFSYHSSKGVDWVFVEHESYQRSGLYGDENGVYGDNQVCYNSNKTVHARRKQALTQELHYFVAQGCAGCSCG